MSVKRWTGYEMDHADDGDWVEFEEYKKLEMRVKQLEAAVDALLGFEHINDRGTESGSWQSNELEEAFKKAKEARAK